MVPRQIIFYIEDLNLFNWLFYVWPRLRSASKVYYIDASRLGVKIAGLTAILAGKDLEQLKFRLIDIKDEKGQLLRLRIAYQDLQEIQDDILKNPVFQSILRNQSLQNRKLTFLAKQAISFVVFQRETLFRAQLLTHIVSQNAQRLDLKDAQCFLFLQQRLWSKEIGRYAAKYGVKTIMVKNTKFDPRAILAGLPGIKFFLKMLYFKLIRPLDRSMALIPAGGPRLAVEYYGHLNLDQPEMHSDLFFWQQSKLSGKDVFVSFALPQDPLDDVKMKELSDHGMSAGVLHPKATTVDAFPVFSLCLNINAVDRPKRLGRRSEERWLFSQLSNYHYLHQYWQEYFHQNNIKIYVSWYKYCAQHCVIADAIQSLGGVAAIYQRAFEELPSVETTIATDIVFGFSQENAVIERLAGSTIPYFVTVGYLGDHRFSLLKAPAKLVRDQIKKNGARHIMAFFDENSHDDARWFAGHEFMRDNYRFLLEKVLSEPWLGLVFKPKAPKTLRRRLGTVSQLLKKAEETGRCFVFEEGTLHGSYPPAIAALASDVAIHGHLCAATAGVEAALAGVPTLLMDREGWPQSKLYQLGKGKVVFNKWDDLWESCIEHWKFGPRKSDFGNWSGMLNKIDPFRDGRAAERIGTYLMWLLDGFKAGLPRETVLADAADRYCQIWGRDKVSEVK